MKLGASNSWMPPPSFPFAIKEKGGHLFFTEGIEERGTHLVGHEISQCEEVVGHEE